MRTRVRAQITIYAALSIMLVISLMCTCIYSATAAVQKNHMAAAAHLSMEAVFARYSNALFDEFGVFACKDSNSLEADFRTYINENMQTQDNAKNITILSSNLTNKVHMTDSAGDCIRQQILSYMRYRTGTLLLEQLEGMELKSKRGEAVKAITESITKCEEEACQLDKHMLRLLEQIEGIKVNENGIECYKNVPVFTGEYFVKAALNTSVSMEAAAITDSRVYESAKRNEKYVDLLQLFTDMQDSIQDCEELEPDEIEALSQVYEQNYKKAEECITAVKECTQNALEEINAYEQDKIKILQNISFCRQETDNKKEALGEELYDSLSKDISEMQREQEADDNAVCDIKAMQSSLTVRLSRLEQIQQNLLLMPKTYSAENGAYISKSIDKIKQSVLGLNNNAMVFDYSKMDFTSKRGLGDITELYDKMKRGVLGFVIEDEMCSDKKIEYTDLAAMDMGSQTALPLQEDVLEKAKNEVLYNTYLFDNFPCYTDYISDEGVFDKETGKCLDYMLEYILYEKNSDKDNLSTAVTELSFVREGMNLACLLTDSVRKAEAETLALSLMGFTGNAAVIKAAKYVILTVWAYGESIMDLKRLCQGKQVELVKTKENWQLSLNNLLNMKFENSEFYKEENKGLSYAEYLNLALYLEDDVKKYYRTMAAMELRMIELGKDDFRMRDYIYSMEANLLYRVNVLNQSYERNIKYSYG